MAIIPAAIYPIARAELSQLLLHAWGSTKPHVVNLLSDPSGVVTRVGETLVWSGPTGQQVIGGLESLADSQGRIEAAVTGIESTQVAMQGALGVVSTVSIATLGVTSLTGAFMAFRLQSLNKRVEMLGKTIKDVEGKIDAQHKAHLKSSLQFLREFDDRPKDISKLRRALDEARHAANIYGTLAVDEANGSARLPVLNCRGRFYVVSLLTELRCMMSSDDSKQALERIEEESTDLRKVAQVCFEKTLANDPERYLRTAFQPQGVSLNLMTNIYQQAKQLEIITEPQIEDANNMYEYFRKQLERGESYAAWWRRGNIDREMQKLRYLLACLEETSRIEGLKLMIGDLRDRGESLSELVNSLKEWKDKQSQQENLGDAPPVFAYAF